MPNPAETSASFKVPVMSHKVKCGAYAAHMPEVQGIRVKPRLWPTEGAKTTAV